MCVAIGCGFSDVGHVDYAEKPTEGADRKSVV